MNQAVIVEFEKVKEERFFRMKHELTDEMNRFLDRVLTFQERLRIQQEFRNRLADIKNGDYLEALFLLWMMFFYRFENGLRAVEWFYQERKAQLSAEKKRLLETWLSLVPRLIQIVDADEGGVIVEDQMTKERLYMPFCETMPKALPWAGSFCLVEPVDGRYYIHGAAVIEGPRGIQRAYEKIQQLLQKTKRPYEQVAFDHFLEIVGELIDEDLFRHKEITTIDEVTLYYEVTDANQLVRSLVERDVVLVGEWKGHKGNLSFVGKHYMYEDNAAPDCIYVREVRGFIEISNSRLKFMSVWQEAIEAFQQVMKQMGSLVRFIEKKMRKLDVPKDVELQTYAMRMSEEVPRYFGMLANQAIEVHEFLHRPHLDFNGQTIMKMIEQGQHEKVEQWLREREYVSFINGQQFKCSVTVDFNTLRRTFGLPLSPFVTLKEKRKTSVRQITENPFSLSLAYQEEEIEAYRQLDFPVEWLSSFFAPDMIDFFKKKALGKSEATVYKYRTGLTIVAHYLIHSAISSWASMQKEHWEECIVYHYLETNENASINQAKAFLGTVKALAKWLDDQYGTNHASAVRDIVQAVEEEIYDAIRLLDAYVPHPTRKYHAWMHDVWMEAMKNAARDRCQVSGLFEIVSISTNTIQVKHLGDGKAYSVQSAPFACAHAKAGMLIRGTIREKGSNLWTVIEMKRVFPSKAGAYVPVIAQNLSKY
jgi:hypothetical protein